jgi:hypothetical protein
MLGEDRSENFSSVGDSLPNLNDATAKKLGTSDGYDVWGSRHFGSKFDAYCIADDSNKPIAMVVVNTKTNKIDGIEYYNIEKVWVDEKSRGKALTTCIIQFIVKKLNTSLGSGESITLDGEKMFRKLITNKKFKFKIINSKTKELLDIDDVGIDKVFTIPNPYRVIIVEGWGSKNYGKQYLFEPNLLSELRCFRGSTETVWN